MNFEEEEKERQIEIYLPNFIMILLLSIINTIKISSLNVI